MLSQAAGLFLFLNFAVVSTGEVLSVVVLALGLTNWPWSLRRHGVMNRAFQVIAPQEGALMRLTDLRSSTGRAARFAPGRLLSPARRDLQSRSSNCWLRDGPCHLLALSIIGLVVGCGKDRLYTRSWKAALLHENSRTFLVNAMNHQHFACAAGVPGPMDVTVIDGTTASSGLVDDQ